MIGEFITETGGVLTTYNNFDSIPQKFDNLIKFYPTVPPSPHTKEQHEEIHMFESKLHELLRRANASSN